MKLIKCELRDATDQKAITTIFVRLTPLVGHVIAIGGVHKDRVFKRYETVRFVVRAVTHFVAVDKDGDGSQWLWLDVEPMPHID